MPLRRLLGTRQREVWAKLSDEIGGQHDYDFWNGSSVRAAVGSWTITLDTTSDSTMVYTRMRAPFDNPEGFTFTIYPDGLFSTIHKFFGGQDVIVGHDDFDERFIIRGNDEARLVQLFGDEHARRTIMAQPSIFLTVRQDDGWFRGEYPEGVDMLEFLCAEVIHDHDRLKALFELFATMLDRVCLKGSAYIGEGDEERDA